MRQNRMCGDDTAGDRIPTGPLTHAAAPDHQAIRGTKSLEGRVLDGRVLDGRSLDDRALDGRALDGRAPGDGSRGEQAGERKVPSGIPLCSWNSCSWNSRSWSPLSVTSAAVISDVKGESADEKASGTDLNPARPLAAKRSLGVGEGTVPLARHPLGPHPESDPRVDVAQRNDSNLNPLGRNWKADSCAMPK